MTEKKPRKKPGPRKGVKKVRQFLTVKETLFVENFKGGAAAAVRIAFPDCKNPDVVACRIMKRPQVIQALAVKQEAMLKESGKRLARAVDIGRNEIIMIFADIARSGESESARVSAAAQLKDIFGLSAKNDRDTDLFAGWSEEELRQYADTGELPERVRSGVVPGAGETSSRPA